MIGISAALDGAHALRVLHRTGMISLPALGGLPAAWRDVRRWGPVAGAIRIAAARTPHRTGLVDDLGPLTFADLDRRSDLLAGAWTDLGIGSRDVVGVLCRDHRGLVDAALAAAKLGARLVLVNTGLAGPQVAQVAKGEGLTVLVHDDEFGPAAASVPPFVRRFTAWTDGERGAGGRQAPPALESLIAQAPARTLRPPARTGGVVLLTSGTTGAPKGAPRRVGSPLVIAQLLDRVPLRVGESTLIAAPLFHGTGFAHLMVAFAFGSTAVVSRRFDAEAALRALERHRCSAVILVPTMLRRILDLGPDPRSRHDLSALRIVFVAGSALPPDLGDRAMAAFGEVLYNLYGSTEVAVAAVATPADWRAAPGTVGRPPHGCRVRLYGERGPVARPGERGRIFVGSGLGFAGYTDGRSRETRDGLLDTGDVGHFDAAGRLFVDGRADDMIVSGGENVHPGEVEDLLAAHPGIVEAAVVGVPDAEFGQRLRAYVVPRDGAGLTGADVRAHVKANLARHKVPRDVLLVAELPRNATGKLLRHRLLGLPGEAGERR
ncbi:AMP-binding protein [Spirillospora sp. NPDC049024]